MHEDKYNQKLYLKKSAENIGALFLTTDDLLIKHIRMQGDNISIEVNNPLKWLMEELYGDENTK